MAAITATREGPSGKVGGGAVYRYSGTGAQNSADTLTTDTVPAGQVWRLAYVTVKYSASPTQAGVTVSLDSGLGAAFDATLHTGSANAQTTVYLPDGDVYLVAGDAIVVSAPAAGGVITASVVVVLETV